MTTKACEPIQKADSVFATRDTFTVHGTAVIGGLTATASTQFRVSGVDYRRGMVGVADVPRKYVRLSVVRGSESVPYGVFPVSATPRGEYITLDMAGQRLHVRAKDCRIGV